MTPLSVVRKATRFVALNPDDGLKLRWPTRIGIEVPRLLFAARFLLLVWSGHSCPLTLTVNIVKSKPISPEFVIPSRAADRECPPYTVQKRCRHFIPFATRVCK